MINDDCIKEEEVEKVFSCSKIRHYTDLRILQSSFGDFILYSTTYILIFGWLRQKRQIKINTASGDQNAGHMRQNDRGPEIQGDGFAGLGGHSAYRKSRQV